MNMRESRPSRERTRPHLEPHVSESRATIAQEAKQLIPVEIVIAIIAYTYTRIAPCSFSTNKAEPIVPDGSFLRNLNESF